MGSPPLTTSSESSCLGIPDISFLLQNYKDKAKLQHCSVNCEDFSGTIPAVFNIKDLKVNCNSLCSQENGVRDILCSLPTLQTLRQTNSEEHILILYTQSLVCRLTDHSFEL